MRGPDKWSPIWYCPDTPAQAPAAPTVYPFDDQVEEKVLGPDGDPVTVGQRRQHPIGFQAATTNEFPKRGGKVPDGIPPPPPQSVSAPPAPPPRTLRRRYTDQLVVRLDPALKSALQADADNNGRTLAQSARHLLRRALEQG